MNKNCLLQMSTVVVDLVFQIDCMPVVGGDAVAQSSKVSAGGGFNAMMAARRAGMDVTYGGAHGTGLFADVVRLELAEADIPLLQARATTADQGCCVVLVDDKGERTFVSSGGRRGLIQDGLLAPVDPADFGWVLLSGYELSHADGADAMDRWLADVPEECSFLFDPAPVIGAIPKQILGRALSKASWISASADEATVLTGIASPRESAHALATRDGTQAVGAVVRCGEEGCWLAQAGGPPTHIPGFAVETVDTNGAGDTHIGAFLAALGGGASPVEAGRYANAAAALSTTQLGPSTSPEDMATRALLDREAEPEAEPHDAGAEPQNDNHVNAT